jgi:hypothetical protein
MQIELSDDEALVLFELLARHEDDLRLDIQHEAERIVLWRIGCALESELLVPWHRGFDRLGPEGWEHASG